MLVNILKIISGNYGQIQLDYSMKNCKSEKKMFHIIRKYVAPCFLLGFITMKVMAAGTPPPPVANSVGLLTLESSLANFNGACLLTSATGAFTGGKVVDGTCGGQSNLFSGDSTTLKTAMGYCWIPGVQGTDSTPGIPDPANPNVIFAKNTIGFCGDETQAAHYDPYSKQINSARPKSLFSKKCPPIF